MTEKAHEYVEAITEAGSPLNSFLAFVDRTNVYISRPKGPTQRATYIGNNSN